MKVMGLKETTLDACVDDAQSERVVVTRNGKPVALIVGVEGLDAEQLELGSDDEFWKMIGRRRKQKVLTRSQLEQKLGASRRAVVPSARKKPSSVHG